MVITIIQCLLLILDIYVFLELICKLFTIDLSLKVGKLPNTAINEWIVGILTALIIFLNTIKS